MNLLVKDATLFLATCLISQATSWLVKMAIVHSLFQMALKILPSLVTSLKLLAIQCSQQNILFVQRWKLYTLLDVDRGVPEVFASAHDFTRSYKINKPS